MALNLSSSCLISLLSCCPTLPSHTVLSHWFINSSSLLVSKFLTSHHLFLTGEVVLDLSSTIADAPIYINGFFLRHLFKTDSELARTLQGHYLHSILGQLYKIVGWARVKSKWHIDPVYRVWSFCCIKIWVLICHSLHFLLLPHKSSYLSHPLTSLFLTHIPYSS